MRRLLKVSHWEPHEEPCTPVTISPSLTNDLTKKLYMVVLLYAPASDMHIEYVRKYSCYE